MRTWIDIDLDKLVSNYREACGLTASTVTCVLKANAYGHGAAAVARALEGAGCHSFAVSCVREALELRRAGVGGEILVMGVAEPEEIPAAIEAGVTLTAASVSDLDLIDSLAPKKAPVHLKADTGFHRLGVEPDEATAAVIAHRTYQNITISGLFSHLGLVTPERDRMQYEALMRFHGMLEKHGLRVPDVHLCDSIGLVRYPAWHLSRVRVGALLYGGRPYRSENVPFRCEETLCFRALVAQVRDVKAGEIVGYADDAPLQRDSRIATVCAGYGDGYPRRLSGGAGKALIRGRLAPTVGLVCMDQMMVDVTDIPGVAAGDTATLLGGGISYEEMARWAGTNRNECLTILSRRPVRVCHQGGRTWTEDLL